LAISLTYVGVWTYRGPSKALAKNCRERELAGRSITRHTLRHTAITHLVNAGVDLPTVQRISGHKTFQMVCHYAHQNQEHVQAALSKLDSRIVATAPSQISAANVMRDYTRITLAKTTPLRKLLQALEKVGGPGPIRTGDQRIMSPLL
jgi:Phage integrase family